MTNRRVSGEDGAGRSRLSLARHQAHGRMTRWGAAAAAAAFALAAASSSGVLASLPAEPPLGPPQPPCTTCRWPQHSWRNVPASVHTSRTDTGPDGTFTAADVADLAKFPLITMEKWQGTDAVDASGKRVFIWEEDAWINSARQIKAAAPNASVVAWMDTMLVYTGWRLDGNASIINHTLNPDADSSCATGHFRPAEFLEKYPQLLVKNTSGQLAVSQYGHCHVYDHTQPRVQQYWRDMCLRITAAGLDGCGADFSSGDHNSVQRNSVQDTMSFLGIDNKTAVAWRQGKRQMMIDTTKALGNGLLIGKDAAELGDHVNAVLHEGCSANNGTITLLRSITAKSRATGKRLLYQCHTTEGLDNATVAAFLIGAGVDHYIASGGWHTAGKNPISNRAPILDLPLGDPTADAAYDASTTTWTRSFASGTKVTFNASCATNRRQRTCPGTFIAWATVPEL